MCVGVPTCYRCVRVVSVYVRVEKIVGFGRVAKFEFRFPFGGEAINCSPRKLESRLVSRGLNNSGAVRAPFRPRFALC